MVLITALVNQKGGVGKTTTTVNLAAYLATFGKKVLIIDIDPQGNATVGFGIERDKLSNCIYNVLIQNISISEVIFPTSINHLFVVPSTSKLAGAEVELVNEPDRENRLKRALLQIDKEYEYIFIDCPPSLNLLTINALASAHEVIIPIQCEYYALEGISQLMKTLELIRKGINPMLKIGGIVLTMYDSRTLLSNQVAEEAKKYFGGRVFKTIIPRNVRLAEAPSFGQPILFYDPSSTGASAYENLSREVLGDAI